MFFCFFLTPLTDMTMFILGARFEGIEGPQPRCCAGPTRVAAGGWARPTRPAAGAPHHLRLRQEGLYLQAVFQGARVRAQQGFSREPDTVVLGDRGGSVLASPGRYALGVDSIVVRVDSRGRSVRIDSRGRSVRIDSRGMSILVDQWGIVLVILRIRIVYEG